MLPLYLLAIDSITNRVGIYESYCEQLAVSKPCWQRRLVAHGDK